VWQVFVPGANLSMGDMHFSQGDGEVSFCGAIEMSGFLEIRTTVIKGGMKLLPVVRNLALARRLASC
jgi:formamidase